MSGIQPTKNAYEMAKTPGGKHEGFHDNYVKRSNKELYKSIRSYKKQLEKHQQKLANPPEHVTNWDPARILDQETQIKRWKIEITDFSEKIEILQGLLKERQ